MSDIYPLGTRIVHSVEGDVGVVTGFRSRADLGLVMHTVSGCSVELPGDELRRWDVLVDGSLTDAYKALLWDCHWDIGRSDDNFMCIVGDTSLMDSLVVLGLAEKKGRYWYRALSPTPECDASPLSGWAD